jgi:hypothetical protein
MDPESRLAESLILQASPGAMMDRENRHIQKFEKTEFPFLGGFASIVVTKQARHADLCTWRHVAAVISAEVRSPESD